ncbi:MAG TPA: serine/threonine-protein kinase [Anoxybacillus sp.]|nr:serine/threonine-protein kinase [Anoxybacillus sp.]
MKRWYWLYAGIERFLERPYQVGKIVNGRYRIESCLGMGSYGITYIACDIVMNQYVVLKQMRKTKRNKGTFSFQREAQILKMLNHPRIPKLYDSFMIKGIPHLVMELISGKTVEDLIFKEEKMFTERESFQLLMDILAIVQYIHQNGIVHRDLRIPNVILKEGNVYIIDFGLARFLTENERENNDDIIEKKLRREISIKSDFYALGHFMLFLLYSTYEPTVKEERSWEEELSLSREARYILRKMLQIDTPYEDIHELSADINRLLQNLDNGGVKDVIV